MLKRALVCATIFICGVIAAANSGTREVTPQLQPCIWHSAVDVTKPDIIDDGSIVVVERNAEALLSGSDTSPRGSRSCIYAFSRTSQVR